MSNAPIELTVEYRRLNSFFADYAKNISKGSTFIPTARPLRIGTEFVFKLVVPGLAEPLALRGKVQWVVRPERKEEAQRPGMGIGYVFESDEERLAIERIVERLMVKSLGPRLSEKIIGRKLHPQEPDDVVAVRP